MFDFEASGDWIFLSKGNIRGIIVEKNTFLVLGNLKMHHNANFVTQPEETLLINSTSDLVNGAFVSRWQYPCVEDVECKIVSEDSVSLLGSIILSSVFIVLTILLMVCLKLCHWKASQNDKSQVKTNKLSNPFLSLNF